MRRLYLGLFGFAFLLLVTLGAGGWWLFAPTVSARPRLWDHGVTEFDVIVMGSEPEGIVAAVAAAQEGGAVLLMTPDTRVGGLFVKGEMNSLDLRREPELYQRGLFETWWQRVGAGSAFDVQEAEAAFEAMLAEAGVTLYPGVTEMTPVIEDNQLVAIATADTALRAHQFIDATADADIAAAAGVGYSLGFAAVGLEARMVDTLVFRIDNVDWPQLVQGIRSRNPGYAAVDERAAWGHFGGYPASYQALEPGIRLRGLNLGLQNDGSVLVNALMIDGIDPFDPVSREDGKARAAREALRIIDYLRKELPGFERARFGGVAERLYIRETRHIDALCSLTIDDVLDNRVTDLDVAAGGYPLDVHPLTPFDSGFVFGVPEIYGVQLCVTVPQAIDGLWVVGRSAGFDPTAASSARVVPFGMALAEAVGVAAVKALGSHQTPANFLRRDQNIHRPSGLRGHLRCGSRPGLPW
jgi:ribulose 1,5-bisphosphate synthetase/thiazole synthase